MTPSLIVPFNTKTQVGACRICYFPYYLISKLGAQAMSHLAHCPLKHPARGLKLGQLPLCFHCLKEGKHVFAGTQASLMRAVVGW